MHRAHGAATLRPQLFQYNTLLCKNAAKQGASVPLMQRFMQFMARSKILTDARLLEMYPPFVPMRIRVLEIADGWRSVRILLPLNALSRNPGGVMFGGWQAALADPIAALACARVFPGYSVWTRAMTISFDHGGNSDLEMRFSLTPAQEADIRIELERDGRSTPTFEYAYVRQDGVRCTVIRNTVAIRPRGYKRATTPPASPENVE
jgi:acyl-coenzyme A thioesterase PaaI-like protein